MNDPIIRPYVGDLLAVILVYCFLKAFLKIRVLPAAMGSLLFAYLLEILQYFSLVDRLGLGHSQLARTLIGSSFEWIDLLAYTAGIAIVLVIETKRTSTKVRQTL
ncbi:DUF2809 domain-containing protein [Paraflavitalea speifideaquila]|uniref:ribosomal maturation YjgA family protein n=1 Tax=Paraflavitalea speifideaquila TaxID=3076558 RepID=UPI0028F0888F|nr:DUF2809 domain-containing protein [Paraflavitalea speifideiaquila]